jgi:pseudouridine synthase
MEERVQKLMARVDLGSRRQNEDLIRAGRVRINGRTAKLGDRADPESDRVEVDGRLISLRDQKHIYVALHKPKGIISSLEDELGLGRRTVRDLVKLPGHLYPVGRLDKQSAGLMLMTNDGNLAHYLTHPRYEHEKTYLVQVDGAVPTETLNRWRKGLWLDGRKTAPAKIRVVKQDISFTQLEIIMREGRKRQIRRIASMLGYPVRRLVREKIGPLALGDLRPGEWRHLSPDEVAELRKRVTESDVKRRRRPARARKGEDRQEQKG